MSLQTIQAAQIRAGAARITSGALQARRYVTRPHLGKGMPFGALYNFGIAFLGAGVLVHSGILYTAGVRVEWPEPSDLTVPTIATLAHDDVFCVVYALATKGVAIAVRDPAQDSGGEIIRALGKVAVVGGVPRLVKWWGGGIESGLVRGAY